MTPTERGLYEVGIPRGEDLVTHGPDTALAGPGNGARSLLPGDPERPPVCGSDYYQHVLYARTPRATDHYLEVKPRIQAAVRRMNAVLNADSLASGGGTADYKLLCDSAGAIRVDRLVSPSTRFDRTVAAARAAGFDAPNADYTIFFDDDGGGACGIGSYAEDERLVAGNASNLGGGYAVAYNDCWYDETPMHEVGHNQGAVQYGAPHSTGIGGHCYDEADVLCYSPDGGNLHQNGTVARCTDRIHFDCGADDYFDTAPEPGEYLATHWNLGSPLNRFITFGPHPAPPPTSAGTDAEDGSEAVRLRRGKARRGTAAEAGGWRNYWIKVPARRRALRVVLNGPGCAAGGCETNLDLYVRRGMTPTDASFARRAWRPGSDERARIRGAKRGRWYVGVRTVSGHAGAPFKIKASY